MVGSNVALQIDLHGQTVTKMRTERRGDGSRGERNDRPAHFADGR